MLPGTAGAARSYMSNFYYKGTQVIDVDFTLIPSHYEQKSGLS